MTLDDETASRIANETWAKRGKRHTVSGEEYVRAGWDARDAEVEELRAERDRLRDAVESTDRMVESFEKWCTRALTAEAVIAKVREYIGPAENGPWHSTYRFDILAILDESPTERETPADEVTAPEVLKAVDDFRRIQDADFEHYDAALAGYLMAEFKITRRGGSR